MTTTDKLMTLAEADKLPIRDVIAFARAAGIVPPDIKSDEAAYGVLLKARELGIPPMAAFSSIHVIENKPTCSVQLMLACARNRLGDRLKYEIAGDSEKCVGRMSTDGGERWNAVTITYKEMQAAGYTQRWNKDKSAWETKKNWKNPQAMLRARVIAALVRLCVPEATLGTYAPEEMQDVADQRHAPRDATPAQLVAAKLLGEPQHASEPPRESAGVPPPAAPDAAPQESAAFLDWREALLQATDREALARSRAAILGDRNLADAERKALLVSVSEIARKAGWTKAKPEEAGAAKSRAAEEDERLFGPPVPAEEASAPLPSEDADFTTDKF